MQSAFEKLEVYGDRLPFCPPPDELAIPTGIGRPLRARQKMPDIV